MLRRLAIAVAGLAIAGTGLLGSNTAYANCPYNLGVCRGDCTINTGTCEDGGTCYVNTGTCSSDCTYNTGTCEEPPANLRLAGELGDKIQEIVHNLT